jgi:hypothetical protein
MPFNDFFTHHFSKAVKSKAGKETLWNQRIATANRVTDNNKRQAKVTSQI